MSFLADILTARAASIELLGSAETHLAGRDFHSAIRADGLSVIAEFKRRSPSKGILNAAMQPDAQAAAYQAGGARAVSVLTEPDYFGGSVDDLTSAKAGCDLPVLWKDFVFDPRQIEAAASFGADAVLLIVRICDQPTLRKLHSLATDLGVEPLVEVFNEAELARALDVGARIIGVNARDLETFEEDPDLVFRLRGSVPADVALVAESAIRDSSDVQRLRDHGIDGALIGEALVRSTDPAAALDNLLHG